VTDGFVEGSADLLFEVTQSLQDMKRVTEVLRVLVLS
jgi:hypothetical protein